MSADLFQALTLGLLVIVILSLFVAVSMLGKIRASLEGRVATREGPSQASGETATVDEAVAEVAGVTTTEPGETPPAGERQESTEVAAAESAGSEDEDSERPYERGGRWYFRRAGELLVYEEGTGEWVPAGAEERATSEPLRRQAEAVEASTEPAVAEAAGESADAERAEPSTSFAGQPLAAAEEQVAALGDAVATGEEATVATGFEEPGGGAVDLEEVATVSNEPVTRSSESFWKCPSCGAVNGSTASSCRMCFTARP